MTASELLTLGDIGPCELIVGELVRREYADFEHGVVAAHVAGELHDYVRTQRLGVVLGPGVGFQIASNPDSVRTCDTAFVAGTRVPELPERGYFQGAPDLAVEVISPDDCWSDVAAKVSVWLQAGCRAVWVIDPPNRTVTTYQSDSAATILHEQDVLEAGETVPGFHLPVRDIFAGL